MRMHPLLSEHAAKLYIGHIDAANGKEKIPGFLNLDINSEPPEKILLKGPTTLMVRLWKQARRDADAAGRRDNPILLVNFGYDKDCITYGIELTSDSFATARGSPPPAAVLSALPSGMELPSKVDGFRSVLRKYVALFHRRDSSQNSRLLHSIIDKYIELDGENKLKLRQDLRKVDKEFLRRLALTN